VSVLQGAFRVGEHVFLALNDAEVHRRVISVGARDVERWSLSVDDHGAWLQFEGEQERTPRLVALVEIARDPLEFGAFNERAELRAALDRILAHPIATLIFDVPDGATLAEIAVRTELQGATLDTAMAATIIARGVRLAGVRPATDEGFTQAPLVDPSTIRVAWDGSVWFLGHLPRSPREPMVPRRASTPITVERARAMVERFLGLGAGAGGLLDWLRAISRGTTDEMLAANPETWRTAAHTLDQIAERLGAVDDKTLAGLVQRLFPDDYARSLDTREQLAMLTDDDLRGVREAGPKSP
jgi:hypothetical protein